jgi:competence protein ComEC
VRRKRRTRIENFKPQSVVHNGQSTGAGVDNQNVARRYAKEAGVARWYVLEHTIDKKSGLTNSAIDPVACHSVNPRIVALWGQARRDNSWDSDDFDDENNHSVVLRIDYGEASILFTGDLEETTKAPYRAGIERLLRAYKDSKHLLDADVYHVGHHGSHNGTTAALVAAISPEIAVMSVGPPCYRGEYSAGAHKHPRTPTIDDLATAISRARESKVIETYDTYWSPPTKRTLTKAIYATGWDGDITLVGRADGSWEVKTSDKPTKCQ